MVGEIELRYLNWYTGGLWAGWPGFDSQQGQEIFLFTIKFRQVLGPAQPPI
jgi:hypothetical protein